MAERFLDLDPDERAGTFRCWRWRRGIAVPHSRAYRLAHPGAVEGLPGHPEGLPDRLGVGRLELADRALAVHRDVAPHPAGPSQLEAPVDGARRATTTGTFLPQARIYVSSDCQNAGIGFGSAGVLPQAPGFPGEPLYPFGINGGFGGGDLKHSQSTQGQTIFAAMSCVGGTRLAQCKVPVPLPTTPPRAGTRALALDQGPRRLLVAALAWSAIGAQRVHPRRVLRSDPAHLVERALVLVGQRHVDRLEVVLELRRLARADDDARHDILCQDRMRMRRSTTDPARYIGQGPEKCCVLAR